MWFSCLSYLICCYCLFVSLEAFLGEPVDREPAAASAAEISSWHTSYEELTRLAETRLAQNTFNTLKIGLTSYRRSVPLGWAPPHSRCWEGRFHTPPSPEVILEAPNVTELGQNPLYTTPPRGWWWWCWWCINSLFRDVEARNVQLAPRAAQRFASRRSPTLQLHVSGMRERALANLRTKILDFRGFHSKQQSNIKGWNSWPEEISWKA